MKLGELCDVQIGRTPARDKNIYWGKGFPWLSIADMNQGRYICKTKEQITEEAVREAGCRLVEPNTVLLSFKLSIGKVSISKMPLYTNEAIASLSFFEKEKVDTSYFYWVLQNIDLLKHVDKAGKGLTLNKKKLVEIDIPLPPLEQQRHIAAVLDAADTLRQKRRESLQKLDELLKSVFLDMFGDPVTNPRGWEVVETDEVIDDIVAGSSYGGEAKELEADELGVLKISAVTTGRFLANEFKAVKISDVKHELIKPRKGDLLFSRANTRELVGATCIVDADYEHLFLPDKLWRIDFDNSRCNNWYFKFLLSDEKFKTELTKTATGTSGSMLNISMEKLRRLEIPLPPIELQNNFAQYVELQEMNRTKLESSLAHLETLFASLQQQLFDTRTPS